jgi:quinolinate synthase
VQGERLRRLDRDDHQDGRRGAPNSHWLVGTELNLVTRIAEEFKPQGKSCSSWRRPCACARRWRGSIRSTCAGRSRTSRPAASSTDHRAEPDATQARVALDRMLAVS